MADLLPTFGLYKHNKTGNRYRVLFNAEWIAGNHPEPDDALSVVMVDNTWLGVHKNYESTSGMLFELFPACWSGNSSDVVPGEPLVVYVSADGGSGRVSVRTVAEFSEYVVLPPDDTTLLKRRVQRFELVGD